MIQIIEDSIFNSKEKYLCHQCNCITQRASHLSKDVFTHYPYSNVYEGRTNIDTPGSIVVCGNGKDQRYIINMFGQYYPGKPKYPMSKIDGTKAREKYFHQCLMAIAKIDNLESLAFPFGIGCGAAGGNWEYYFGTLKNFEKYVNEKQGAKVYIYRRPQ